VAAAKAVMEEDNRIKEANRPSFTTKKNIKSYTPSIKPTVPPKIGPFPKTPVGSVIKKAITEKKGVIENDLSARTDGISPKRPAENPFAGML
jgi:hypothetical protein